jgi:membrane-associated two-gene conflict system component 1 (EACC1)
VDQLTVVLKLRPEKPEEFKDLQEWLTGVPGITVEDVDSPAPPNAQSSGVWEFLSVACGAGGPTVAMLKTLQLWIESHVTTIYVTVGGKSLTVKTADVGTALPAVAEVIKSLESGEPTHDDGA